MQDPEIRRITLPGQLSKKKKVMRPPSQQKKVGYGGTHLSSQQLGKPKVAGSRSRLTWTKRETSSPK
jgi:hypothetical protein